MAPNASHGFAASIATAARTINQQQSLQQTLDSIAAVACESVPGFDAAGISVLTSLGKPETKAATDELVWRLDRVQYTLKEGPCVDSMRESSVVLAPALRDERRWPRYAPEAVEAGVRSQMGVKLHLDGKGTIGGLNLYSTSSDDIDPEAESIAELFAAHAAIALGNAEHREHLKSALQTRKVIGQSIGILMERYALTEDGAFAFLVRVSSTSNIKLRDVAQQLVDERSAQSASSD